MTKTLTVTIDTWLYNWLEETKPEKLTRSEWTGTLIVKGLQNQKGTKKQVKK